MAIDPSPTADGTRCPHRSVFPGRCCSHHDAERDLYDRYDSGVRLSIKRRPHIIPPNASTGADSHTQIPSTNQPLHSMRAVSIHHGIVDLASTTNVAR
jgi:hypothetical protein